MSQDVFTVKIAGPAGSGIKSSGLLLSHILVAHGFNIRDYSEYPSLIRGGHNTYQVSFSANELFAPHYDIDVFFSLLPQHWSQHTSEFNQSTLVFGDDAPVVLPLKDLAQQIGGHLYVNTLCLGVIAYIFSLNQDTCHQIITQTFGSDTPNLKAFDLGFDYASKNYAQSKITLIFPQKITNDKIYEGNEAYSWGFIAGGGNFYAAYPMTPSSGAMHFLAGVQEKYKITFIHPEDEIAAASLCAGAVFAGARAATGTSGGGFALMCETVSLCGAANLGVVFYLVSRPGPATGLPTWTSQGDLLFAVNSGHGEFNKIVIAPGDQAESFEFGAESLNLAAKFNIPVIVLSDKFVAESSASLSDLSTKKADIIISQQPLPGTPGQEYLANSYEHDAAGYAVEDIDTINKNAAVRQQQRQQIIKSLPSPKLLNNNSSNLIMSWGSTKSTILETLKLLENKYDYLQLTTLWPIDAEIKTILSKYQKIFVIENNATAQLVTLLKSQFDFNPVKIILKSDGRPFFPEELVKELKQYD
ncbi:MAG: 2-oxoacid:acceptor oxidoreductase family protein [Candidatus Shapirobacteria bacterium]|nr:2-oxoacid:acceptor oxidoreductase family protein [Candidatus Shapirobacteria bacterium]